MIYSENFKIKFHDTDVNRIARASAVLMYMQEVANRQFETLGPSLDKLRDERQLAFILSRITIRMYKPLRAYDEIESQTWTCESHGVNFERCFRMLCKGNVVAEGVSSWALLNINNRHFVRVEDFSKECGFTPEPMLSLDTPIRFHIPASTNMNLAGERLITYSDLDCNAHMNNTKYPDMLCDFLPDMKGRRVSGITLSFLGESAWGDTLKIYVCPETSTASADSENSVFLIRTVNQSGKVCLEARIVLSDIEQ